MAAVLASARYYRGGFSPCLSVSARRVRVPGGSTFHLEPVTIHPCWNLTGTGYLLFCLDSLQNVPELLFI